MIHNNTSYPPVFVRNNYNSIWEAFRTLLGTRTAPGNHKLWLSLSWCGVLGAGCSWAPCTLISPHQSWSSARVDRGPTTRPRKGRLGRDGRVRGRRPDFQCSPPLALPPQGAGVEAASAPLGLSFLTCGEGAHEAGLPFSTMDT